jgi:hypothetical protein
MYKHYLIGLFFLINYSIKANGQAAPQVSHSKSIYIETFCKKHKISTATGFFLLYKGVTYFITNYHVVMDKEALSNKYKSPEKLVPDIIKTYLVNKNGQSFSLELLLKNDWRSYPILHNSHTDVAILKIDVSSIIDIKSYQNILSTRPLINNENCYEIGYPKDYLKNRDFFVGKRTEAKVILLTNLRPKVADCEELTAKLMDGSSGSPVYDNENKIIGIHFSALYNYGSLFITKKAIIDCIEKGTKIY